MIGFYDPDGNPLTYEDWSIMFGHRFIDSDRSWWQKRTVVNDDVSVSTVWIGLDRNFSGGPPLTWEGKIFGGEHDDNEYLYPSREAALAHHDWLVTALRQGIDPESEMPEDAQRYDGRKHL